MKHIDGAGVKRNIERCGKVIRRISDGKYFRPVIPAGMYWEDALTQSLEGLRTLQGVEYVPAKWWQFWTFGHFVDTDETWTARRGEYETLEVIDVVIEEFV